MKVRTVRANSLEEVKRAEKYGQIVQTRSGSYEFHFPTKLNKQLQAHLGKDFDMCVTEEGETLRIMFVHDKEAKPKTPKPASMQTRRQATAL